MADATKHNADEQRLAQLGYRQELHRTWSGFNNFAISFSIICILAGCFTSFSQAWNNGGPAVISIGWPVIVAFILLLGLCMSELLSAFPTSGGIYWWASKLGGARSGYYTGWLNLIGLLAGTASIGYGAAYFLDLTIGTFSPSWAASYTPTRQFIEFLVIITVMVAVNVMRTHLLAIFNSISVWWQLVGVAVIIAILIAVPAHHESVSWVLTHRINNSGWFGGKVGGVPFWFIVLPFGFLLTQYTMTGFDASAHMSEETNQASSSAAKGLYRSILYAGIAGWLLELAFLFAVQPGNVAGHVGSHTAITGEAYITSQGGFVTSLLGQALSSNVSGFILIISTVGQLFCTLAVITSTSRMMYAFSRDGAVPLARRWARLNKNRTPVNAVLAVGVVAVIVTLPALWQPKVGGVYTNVVFNALTSVTVIGLFLAFIIPVYQRWRLGSEFETGPWNLRRHYRWMAPLAIGEIVVMSVVYCLPFTPFGAPWSTQFNWRLINYSPIVVVGTLLALWIGWHTSAKHWFTGPKHTIDLPEGVTSAHEPDAAST
jgi:amino acid transporter